MTSKFCNLKNQQKVFKLHLNSAASCCRAYPESLLADQTIQQRIDQWGKEAKLLYQGIELSGCKVCWDDEKQNKLSYRQQHGQTADQNHRIEILFSNLCNQMCSYCSPQYSSTWQDSIIKDGEFTRISASASTNLELLNINQSDQSRLLQICDYIDTCDDNSINVTLLGGEPLMQFQSLQTLLELRQIKIRKLTIVTNLNPPKAKFLEWVLINFPQDKLRINISLDATPEFNHVPRAGFNQAIFLKNMQLLTQYQIKPHFQSTISATSIFDLPNFLNWIRNHGHSVEFFSLNNPTCLNPEFVPVEFRQEILKNIQKEIPIQIDQALNCTQPMVDLKLFEQYNYLTQYFQRTNTDLIKINNPLFHEYWQWLTERFQK
jgi:sulfatase maturation enzyme AslB (radical SAM superfamily)